MENSEAIAAQLTAPGKMFEIENIKVNGVKVRNWKNAPTSMVEILEQSRAHGDKEFIVYQGERLTFEEHYRQVASVAQQLVVNLGIEKGDRVAIAMRNYPEWSVAFWAAVSAGAIVVPLNAWWTSKELEYGLDDSGAKLVFADQQRLERLGELDSPRALVHRVAVRCDSVPEGAIDFQSLLSGVAAGLGLPDIEILPDDDATIFYTSGTTGFPKGALGTHRNFCSVVFSMGHAQMKTMLRMGLSQEDIQAMRQIPQASLLTIPLFHVSGCHGLLTTMLTLGGKLVILDKWDPQVAADAIEREKITAFSGVPSMIGELLTHTGAEERDLSSLMSFGYGGAPAPPELLRLIKSRAPYAGIMNGWGITETSSGISSISGEDYLRNPDSVGWPIAVCEVKIVNEVGEELLVGEQGELWVRGPNVTKGYWNNPAATRESFSDGWFHTGDIGRIDDEGRIYVLDRLKDMIIRGGENIYCAEVEAALVEHPLVKAACVFGIPHKTLGEEVAAVVQVPAGDKLDEQKLQEYAAGKIAKFKVPVKIWLCNEALPVGATGKVQKKEIRGYYLDQLTNGAE